MYMCVCVCLCVCVWFLTAYRYQDVLSHLNPPANVESQAVIVRSVAEYWQHSPQVRCGATWPHCSPLLTQHITVIMDKLYSFKVVEATALVNWIFSRTDLFHM